MTLQRRFVRPFASERHPRAMVIHAEAIKRGIITPNEWPLTKKNRRVLMACLRRIRRRYMESTMKNSVGDLHAFVETMIDGRDAASPEC